MRTDNSLSGLKARAVEALREYRRAEKGETTAALRAAAEALVGTREFFLTREGQPDWKGATYAYRQTVREVMTDAGIPADEVPTVQSAIRYHVSVVLRERLDDETLDALGLRRESARERAVLSRAQRADLTALFRGGDPITDPEDVILAATFARSALSRVDAGKLRRAPKKRREEVYTALDQLAGVVDDLRGVTK